MVFLALTITTLLVACFRPIEAGDEPFRDPLTGRLASGRSIRKSTKTPLLKVSLTEKGDVFTLAIGLTLPPGGYTYSTNPDFTGATRFKLTQMNGLEPVEEEFVADHEPKVEFQPVFNETVEKFTDAVAWTRKFRLRPNAQRADAYILGQVKYQICDADNCKPFDETFLAVVGAPADVVVSENAAELKSRAASLVKNVATPPAPAESPVKPDTAPAAGTSLLKPFETEVIPQRGRGDKQIADPIKVHFRLAPANAKPGEVVLLSVTMELNEGWHTFALDQNPKNAGLPTEISLTKTHGLKPAEESFSPSLAPERETSSLGLEQRVHHKQITWTMPLSVEQAEYGLSGSLAYQICAAGKCLPQKEVAFELGHLPAPVTPPPAVADPNTSTDPGVTPGGTNTGGPFADLIGFFKDKTIEPVDVKEARTSSQSSESLGLYLLYAFIGGLILNVMPCVLPVIGIKVLSFAQQAGESRRRILALNLLYSAGVIAVFIALASLAVFAKLGWGNLFQQPEFQIVMSILVFAMGLSLLGVFEIPLPGLVGSAASHQHQEGLTGAFMTGVFATLLATPCSGPFLGVTLGWSVKQPALVTYLIWTVMGLGMAAPYALLGMFPGWVKFLPRPGNWMVTFKQVCGFLLLGTVIFLMNSMTRERLMLVLILLLVIGFSLWMIGNLYHINSSAGRKWTIRLFASVLTVLTAWWLLTPSLQLPWKSFAGDKVEMALESKRTVLIDFTADWCLSCKTNEKLALNTSDTLDIVQKHKVLTLKADWTDNSPEIKRWLEAFDSISVPLTVIFPAHDPTHPIVIRDLYSKRTLLESLSQAVAGKTDINPKLTQR